MPPDHRNLSSLLSLPFPPHLLRDRAVSTEASGRVIGTWQRARFKRFDVLAAPTGPGDAAVTDARSTAFVSPHQGSVMDVRIDPSKDFALSCSTDGVIAVSQMTVSGQLETLCCVQRDSVGAHRHGVHSVCWYPHDSGMFVSGGADQMVKVWDSNALEAVLTFNLEGAVYETRMSPSAASTHNLVAIAGDMNHVTLGDIGTGTATHILTGHTAPVWSCAWSGRSEWELVSGSSDGQVRLWDVRRPGTRWVFDANELIDKKKRRFVEHAQAHEAAVTGCASVPGGLYWMTTGNDGRPRLWDVESKRNMMITMQKRCSKAKHVRRVSFTDDGRFLFHPSENGVHVFEVASGRLMRTLAGGHFKAVQCAAWNGKYEQLLTGGADKALLVWGVPFGEMDDQDAWSEDEYYY